MSYITGNILELIERSIFHRLNKECVNLGYYVDLLTTEPAINLVSINVSSRTLILSGNHTSRLTTGCLLQIKEGVNKGFYTVQSNATFTSPNTTVVVKEAIPSNSILNPAFTLKYSDNALGANSLQTDVATIVNSKGFAIEIFGVSSPDAKGLKKIPRILVIPGERMPTSLGSNVFNYFIPDGGSTYNKVKESGFALDLTYMIYTVASNAKETRVIHEVVSRALPNLGYIPTWNDPTNNLFVEYQSYRPGIITPQGLIEDIYTYKIGDIFTEPEKTVATGISKITEITTEFEGDDGEYDDTLITT